MALCIRSYSVSSLDTPRSIHDTDHLALYLPCATLLYEWFQDRRGIATGIMFAGTGVGGTVFPFVVTALLNTFGYKATMISLSVGFLLLNGVALMFIKRRIPLAAGRTASARDHKGHKSVWRSIDWSFLRKRGIWTATAVILATAMGNFIPSLWIPSEYKGARGVADVCSVCGDCPRHSPERYRPRGAYEW